MRGDFEYEMAKTFRAGVGSGDDYGGNGWLRQQYCG
jgi:hypothetical protein